MTRDRPTNIMGGVEGNTHNEEAEGGGGGTVFGLFACVYFMVSFLECVCGTLFLSNSWGEGGILFCPHRCRRTDS